MSAAGLAFAAVECYAESARGKTDSWNSMLGGMAAGAVVGSITKRIDIVTSTSLAMGVFLFAVDYAGPLGGLDESAEVRKDRMYGVLPSQHLESETLSDAGMYCDCGESQGYTAGFTGLLCDLIYEECPDGSVCLNGAPCTRDFYDQSTYHCDGFLCPVIIREASTQ